MPFTSGRATFARYLVPGAPPSAEAVLEKLAGKAFTEQSIGAPEEVELGWVGGEHIYDTRFDPARISFGPVLHFGLRIDTHRVPPEIKRAYRRMNEQAAEEEGPGDRASRRDRQEAGEATDRQIREELAEGRYRRSKMVPVLWNLEGATLYLASTSDSAGEHLAKLFRETFDLTPAPLTAGTMAGQILRDRGRGRDYEDLKPSRFTAPPATPQDGEEAGDPRDPNEPAVPWCFHGTDAKDFLGNEFILWLWWQLDRGQGVIPVTRSDGGRAEVAMALEKSLDLDCAWSITGRTSLRSETPTRLPEARDALAEGKWPRKAGLVLADGGQQWQLTFQGDKFQVSAAALPEAPESENARDEAEHRILMVRQLADLLDRVFLAFLEARTGGAWPAKVKEIGQWIQRRRTGA